jgi:hypothetical protein
VFGIDVALKNAGSKKMGVTNEDAGHLLVV